MSFLLIVLIVAGVLAWRETDLRYWINKNNYVLTEYYEKWWIISATTCIRNGIEKPIDEILENNDGVIKRQKGLWG